jgi:hypothetical protein
MLWPVWISPKWYADYTVLENKAHLSLDHLKCDLVFTRYKKCWEELIAYFPLIRHGLHRKRRLQQLFVAVGTSLPGCYLATIGAYTGRPIDSPFIKHEPHRKWSVQKFLYYRVYSLPRERVCRAVAQHRMVGYTLQNCCLAIIRGIQRRTDWWEGFLKYAVEMGSVAMIYISSFIKIGSGIQKFQSHRSHKSSLGKHAGKSKKRI